MKTVLYAGVLIAALVASPVAQDKPKYGVTVTTEKGVDYTKLKTYSWGAVQHTALKSLDDAITKAVDRELQALGLAQAGQGQGDAIVTFAAFSRIDVDTKAAPTATGARPSQPIGTLAVQLTDPKTKARMLRLRADKPFDTKTKDLQAEVDKLVIELFAKYPTRTVKK